MIVFFVVNKENIWNCFSPVSVDSEHVWRGVGLRENQDSWADELQFVIIKSHLPTLL